MKTISITFLFIFCLSLSAFAVTEQEFDRVMNLITSGDFEFAQKAIQQIHTENPHDPEYYVLAVNYYFHLAYEEVVEIIQELPPDDESAIVLEDSLGNQIGYMESHDSYDLDTVRIGLDILQQGINNFPDRLDMHFGVVYITEETELYHEMSKALINAMKRTKINNHKWLWAFSKPLEDEPVEFLRENTQFRVSTLFELETRATDSLVKEISNQMIKTFPNSTYGHTNLGIYYSLYDQPDSSLYHLHKALEIDPADIITIANVAEVYRDIKDNENAKKYFARIMEIGSAEDQAWAREQLNNLD